MNLSGKDFFTEAEAAHYACVSQSQFRKRQAEYGILYSVFMGKKVYRKVDIQRAMEQGAIAQNAPVKPDRKK